jgi:outer membrane lipoprotein-sorting protein
MFNKAILFGAVALAGVAPLSAQEAAPDAAAPEVAAPANKATQAIVKNVPKILDSSFQSTFAIDVFNAEDKKEQAVNFTVKFQDMKHWALDITVTAEDEFEGEVTQKFNVMADGSYLYLDSPDIATLSQGFLNGPAKLELAFVEKMMKSEMGFDLNDGKAAKGKMSEALGQLSFKEEGSTEGKRRFLIDQEPVTGFMVFNAENWFLDNAEMNAEGMKTVIKASDSSKVKEWPEGTFTFKAAEGVVVTDVTSMLQGMMGGMGGGEETEEDLEF